MHLAETFHTALREEGLRVASSSEEANLLLTGASAATDDLVHHRFDWSQCKRVRRHTGETLYTLLTGQGGVQSVETGVRTMAGEIKRLFCVSMPSPPLQNRPGDHMPEEHACTVSVILKARGE